MGQSKRMYEEMESLLVIPDDLDYQYQEWLIQKEQEQLAYEEMLSDTK